MKYLAILAVAVAPLAASAQGFVDSPLCYSWEGGHKSSGSFSKCAPEWNVAAAPKVVAAPVAAPAPVLASPVCPPQIILQPEPQKPKARPKPRPKPQTC